MTVDNRTEHLNLPLPHPKNPPRSVDVNRLRDALSVIDELLYNRPDETVITALIQDAVSGVITQAQIEALIKDGDDGVIAKIMGGLTPSELDTLFELAEAFKVQADSSDASIASINEALSKRARLDAKNTFLEKIIFKKILEVLGTLDVRGDLYLNNKAIITNDSEGVEGDRTGENIDHIWHDDGNANAWNFVSDGTYKSRGNSKLVAGTLDLYRDNLSTSGNQTQLKVLNVSKGKEELSGNRTHTSGFFESRVLPPANATFEEDQRFYSRSIAAYANNYGEAGSKLYELQASYAAASHRGKGDVKYIVGAQGVASTHPDGGGTVDYLWGCRARAILDSASVLEARGIEAVVNPNNAVATVGNAIGVLSSMDYDAGTVTKDPIAVKMHYSGAWSGRKKIGIQQTGVDENQLTGKALIDGKEVAHAGNIASMVTAAGAGGLGVGQSWQDVSGSRAANAAYQNTSGKTIQVKVSRGGTTFSILQVSPDNSKWIDLAVISGYIDGNGVIPSGHYYKLTGNINFTKWAELR